MSPSTKAVEAAGIAGVKQKTNPAALGVADFFEPPQKLQASYAKLIGASDPDRIALIPSASYGLANAAANLHPNPGQEILMIGGQFPSNVLCWQKLAAHTGAKIRMIAAPETRVDRGASWNALILEAIHARTAIVTMGPLHWADGTVFDIARIRKKTAHYGAAFILDATQAIGAMPFDVDALQPDAVISAGYKWLTGPYGLGFAWYGPRFDEGLPIENNWINRRNSDGFSDLSTYEGQYRTAAQRYGMGEKSNFITVPMMQAALDQVLDWGVDNIANYCRSLTDYAADKFSTHGFWVEDADYRAGHLWGVRLPNGASLEKAVKDLEAAQIRVSLRGDAFRISPYLYNEKADIDRLVDVLVKSVEA